MEHIIGVLCHKLNNTTLITIKKLSEDVDNLVLIHVDKKVKIDDFQFLVSNNIHILEERIDISWGSVSLVDATLLLMKEAERYQYSYFSLISGDDLVIKSNKYMTDFLSLNKGYDFIEFQPVDESFINPDSRVESYYPKFFFNKEKRLITKLLCKFHLITRGFLFKNKIYFENNYKVNNFYKGSQWFTLSKNTIEYILNYLNENIWYRDMFENSFCPDESFFHTLIKNYTNSKVYFSPDSLSSSLRYIDWKSGPEYPKVLHLKELYEVKSSNYFFARKVAQNISINELKNLLRDDI